MYDLSSAFSWTKIFELQLKFIVVLLLIVL